VQFNQIHSFIHTKGTSFDLLEWEERDPSDLGVVGLPQPLPKREEEETGGGSGGAAEQGGDAT